jgi:hypothetical protein
MANWAFEIDVADSYIIGLTETLTDKGFRVWYFHHDDQPLYLFSSAYLSGATADNVYGLARQLVRYIDGVSYLLFENKDSVSKMVLTRVFDMDTFSMVNVQKDTAGDIDFSVYRAPVVVEDDNPVAQLLRLVPGEVFIRELLLVLSQGMDFKSMHLVCELVKGYLAEKGGDLKLSGQFKDGSMPLREAQEWVAEMVFGVLERFYGVRLKGSVVKDKGVGDDWYDSLYD